MCLHLRISPCPLHLPEICSFQSPSQLLYDSNYRLSITCETKSRHLRRPNQRVLSDGKIKSTRHRRKCMKGLMSVEEAKEICKSRVKWRSILSAYPARDMAWWYVCMYVCLSKLLKRRIRYLKCSVLLHLYLIKAQDVWKELEQCYRASLKLCNTNIEARLKRRTFYGFLPRPPTAHLRLSFWQRVLLVLLTPPYWLCKSGRQDELTGIVYVIAVFTPLDTLYHNYAEVNGLRAAIFVYRFWHFGQRMQGWRTYEKNIQCESVWKKKPRMTQINLRSLQIKRVLTDGKIKSTYLLVTGVNVWKDWWVWKKRKRYARVGRSGVLFFRPIPRGTWRDDMSVMCVTPSISGKSIIQVIQWRWISLRLNSMPQNNRYTALGKLYI